MRRSAVPVERHVSLECSNAEALRCFVAVSRVPGLRLRCVEALPLLSEVILINSIRFGPHLQVYMPTIFEASALKSARPAFLSGTCTSSQKSGFYS